MSQFDQRQVISASEVGDFVYCAKAWYLKRCGALAEGEQLAAGVTFHGRHATKVAQAIRLRRSGTRLAFAALVMLVLLALYWLVGMVRG